MVNPMTCTNPLNFQISLYIAISLRLCRRFLNPFGLMMYYKPSQMVNIWNSGNKLRSCGNLQCCQCPSPAPRCILAVKGFTHRRQSDLSSVYRCRYWYCLPWCQSICVSIGNQIEEDHICRHAKHVFAYLWLLLWLLLCRLRHGHTPSSLRLLLLPPGQLGL